METTTQEKQDLRTIISNLVSGNKVWFQENAIMVGDKDAYWILNYSLYDRNEINRLTRGLVVAKPLGDFNDPLSLIKSFPFTRFFNSGEINAVSINFANAEMIEKLDGTMVGVMFPDENPHMPKFHTRRMLSTYLPDCKMSIQNFKGKFFNFLPLIEQYVNQLKFSEENIASTYVFEFVHEASCVLTQYTPDQYGLYLLGSRNIKTHRELNEDELDIAAIQIQAKRPRRFDVRTNQEEIKTLFEEMKAEVANFEGFVFRDKETGHRIKIKDPEYVEKHHLLDQLSIKNLIPLVFKGEEQEVLAYFPHAQSKVDQIKSNYSTYLEATVDFVEQWHKTNLTGKDLALELYKDSVYNFAKRMVMKCHTITDRRTLRDAIDKYLKQVALGIGNNDGSPRKLMDLIKLEEKEEEKIENIGEI